MQGEAPVNVLPSFSIYLYLLKYIHVPTIYKSSLNSVVKSPLRGVPRSSSYNGLIMLYWAWQLKTILQSWGILPPSTTTSVGFLLHTSWFLFSFTTPTSAVVSWVFHSLILFLRVRSNHWSHIGSGSRFLCVVPPSLPGHPSQLHSRGRQSSGNIPVMLYRFYPAPVQGWTRSVFLFISLSTKFLANVFTQPITKY